MFATDNSLFTEIKSVLENPALDRTRILQMQRKMPAAKREHMESLIADIDDILKGANKMDFTIFNETELKEMFQAMIEHMPEEIRQTAINEFGSVEHWKQHYLEVTFP